MHRLLRRTATLGLVATLAFAATPAPAQQAPVPLPVPVEGLTAIESIDDLIDIPGLDVTDPVLDLTEGLVRDLAALVDEVLALTPLPNLLSLQGDDAIDAAVAFSQATYQSSDTALLARDDLFADALTTGALQGILDAPLLLTGSGDLDRRTAGEIVRLGVDRIVVVGGEQAINPLVLQKLGIAGIDVDRVGGPTRIETAADAAAQTAPDATTAVLTRAYSAGDDDSQAYADLLAVSPWAAQNGWPVLLTQTETLTASARDRIAASSLEEIIVIGGEGAVSQAVQTELEGMGLAVRRVAGDTRYGTAVAIAEQRGFADSGDTDRLILVEGTASRDDVWAPGFAAAAHAARNDAPILLTNEASLPTETLTFITDGMADNLLDGGPVTMCASFVNPIACEAAGLLLLGNLTDALSLLDLSILDLTNVEQLLADLGLGDLLTLLDSLDGTLDGVIGGLADGDLEAVVAALTGATGTVEGIVDGVIGSDVPEGTDAEGITDIVDEVIEGVVGTDLPDAPVGGGTPVPGVEVPPVLPPVTIPPAPAVPGVPGL